MKKNNIFYLPVLVKRKLRRYRPRKFVYKDFDSLEDEVGISYDGTILRRLLGYLKPYKSEVLIIFASLVIATTVELLTPLVMRHAIDNYIAPSVQENTISQEQRWAGLFNIAAIYLGLLFLSLIFSMVQIYIASKTGQYVMRDLRSQLMKHIMNQSVSYMHNKSSGSLVARISGDVETINELFTSAATTLVKNIALLIGVTILLFSINWLLATIVVLSVLPAFLILRKFSQITINIYRKVRAMFSNMNRFVAEHVAGMEVIHLFRREKKVYNDFKDRNEELLKRQFKEIFTYSVFRPLFGFLTAVSLALVIYLGGILSLEGFVTIGTLVVFLSLVERLYSPIMDFAEKIILMQSAMAGAERVFALIDEKHYVHENSTPSYVSELNDKISFNKVFFGYKHKQPIIKDMSFDIKKGEMVAIVGHTGAGKTTITKLLNRFYDVNCGSITIDGEDIKNFSLENLRYFVQGVQQDSFIFADTVRENISLGIKTKDEDLYKACKMIGAAHFIDNLTNGFDTVLEEQGANLSAGEQQLLAFARVIVRNPQVVVLDEATAHVDTHTEQIIQKALLATLKGRTSLVIAHRLSTIVNADKILVLSDGRIIEQGTHRELIERDGTYKDLYYLQYTK